MPLRNELIKKLYYRVNVIWSERYRIQTVNSKKKKAETRVGGKICIIVSLNLIKIIHLIESIRLNMF